MKERFKFRVWYKNNKKFNKQFCEAISCDGDVLDIDFSEIYGSVNSDDVVVQFSTGLKNKNDKLIYEGDIVKIEGQIGVVQWVDDFAKFSINIRNRNKNEYKDHDTLYGFDYFLRNEIETIGNILENPELLEE